MTYDAKAMDEALAAEVRAVDERVSGVSFRLSEASSRHWSLMDRVALGLGRIAVLEESIKRLELDLAEVVAGVRLLLVRK